MKKALIIVLMGLCLSADAIVSSASAEEMSNYELTRRIERLEKNQGVSGILPADGLEFSGLLEVEAGYASLENEDESDLALATMELGVDAIFNEYVSGRFLLLWEEDDTEPVDLDEGVITLSGGSCWPGYLSAGKMYVPFGVFESNMISGPLTQDLGETRESAIQVGLEMNGFYGSVYLFNGDIDEAGEDSHIDNYGANAGYALETEGFSLDAGISYINNLLDSDGLGDFATETMESAGTELEGYVNGIGAQVVFSTGPLMLIAEYVTALDEPDFIPPAGGGTGFTWEKVAAWNAEAGYFFELGGRPANAGIAFQGTDKAGDFLPETRMMCTVGIEIFESTNLAFEYLHDEFENNHEADVITAQLAFEF